ncbi:hypothetical protein P5673_007663, partial [Acropora cervicornis]
FAIWDSIRSADDQEPCTLPPQETSNREPCSLTPELCVHVISSLACLEDVKLNWLPIKENVEFNILKLAHKSLYHKNSFPESSTAPVFSILKESGTFQHLAAMLFNRLPI